VLVDQDFRHKAVQEYNVETLLHEYSAEFPENYVTVAVVKEKSKIKSFDDLKGRSACFPSYEGAAFLSTLETLNNLNLTSKKCGHQLIDFFAKDSCFWNKDNCPQKYQGDEGALDCLSDGGKDVAFMSLDTFNKLTGIFLMIFNSKFLY
jgi:hypothetical protein